MTRRVFHFGPGEYLVYRVGVEFVGPERNVSRVKRIETMQEITSARAADVGRLGGVHPIVVAAVGAELHVGQHRWLGFGIAVS